MFPEGPPDWPRPDESVRAALDDVYCSGHWGRYHGPYVQRLADALADMHQVPYVLPCASGTIAVELALRALQVGPDDEVVLAGYDFPGNFRAVEAVAGRPVLVDLQPARWVIDQDLLAEAASKRTKAVIVSHLHGTLADMPAIRQWADARGVAIIEDACQVPGALVQGRLAGTWGDVGVLSFGGSKLLTAGRGGALLTPRADVHQRARIANDRGNEAYPLSQLQAAVLLAQLPKLFEQNRLRRRRVEQLLLETKDLRPLVPASWLPSDEPAFYKLAWSFDSKVLADVPRSAVVAAVQAEGIAVDAGFRGFARRSQRRCRQGSPLRHAARAAEQTILLHHPVLLEDEQTVRHVAQGLRKVLYGIQAASERGNWINDFRPNPT